MTIILNGPLGVGKTETAWKLLEFFDSAAILDCDYVGGNVSFFDHRDPDSFQSVIESVAVLAKHQKSKMGVRDFVVSGVFESAEQMANVRSVFSEISHPVTQYLLLAEPEEIERRIRCRKNGGVEREVARGRELHRILSAANEIGTPFDTSNLSIDKTAEILWREIVASGELSEP